MCLHSHLAQPSGFVSGVHGLVASVHGGAVWPTCVGHSSNSVEVCIVLCLPLHPSSLLQINLAEHGNCFSQLGLTICPSVLLSFLKSSYR